MGISDDESNGIIAIDEEFVPVRERTKIGTMEIDFDGFSKTPLKLEEDPTNGCGGMLWIAGRVLGKYLLRQDPSIFENKSMFVCAKTLGTRT